MSSTWKMYAQHNCIIIIVISILPVSVCVWISSGCVYTYVSSVLNVMYHIYNFRSLISWATCTRFMSENSSREWILLNFRIFYIFMHAQIPFDTTMNRSSNYINWFNSINNHRWIECSYFIVAIKQYSLSTVRQPPVPPLVELINTKQLSSIGLNDRLSNLFNMVTFSILCIYFNYFWYLSRKSQIHWFDRKDFQHWSHRNIISSNKLIQWNMFSILCPEKHATDYDWLTGLNHFL